MKKYGAYIFGWNGNPRGGVNDLLCCCDTIEEGETKAKEYVDYYEKIQLMNGSKKANRVTTIKPLP